MLTAYGKNAKTSFKMQFNSNNTKYFIYVLQGYPTRNVLENSCNCSLEETMSIESEDPSSPCFVAEATFFIRPRTN